MHRLQELVRLHRMGTMSREVARLLRMSPNTERKYRLALMAEGLMAGPVGQLPELDVLKAAVSKRLPERGSPEHMVSTLLAFEDEVKSMLGRGARPKSIHDCLRLKHQDYQGSLSALKRLCVRLQVQRGVQARDVVIPVETLPGEVAQVDFGYVGYLRDPDSGRARKAWVFVMVLGFSRHQFAKIVFDQTTQTWLRLHEEAFLHFGGVPQTVVPDNLKAAVIRAAFGIDKDAGLNLSYRELARYYGFKIDPTPPRAPEKKGKVESGVKYVKHSFFLPRDLDEVLLAQQELDRWVLEIAGMRLHGTTGRKPLEVFEQEERGVLLPLPVKPFQPVIWKPALVHRDSHLEFEGRLYSVPWANVGKQVWVRALGSVLDIYADDKIVATHDRRGRDKRQTVDTHLPDYRVNYRHRERSYWEKKADQLGVEVGSYIREVFDSDDVLSKLRCVQGILTHLQGFPPERARAACARASYFGNYTLKGVKSILKLALDLEPLPKAANSTDPAWKPKYARNPHELFLVSGGPHASE